MEHIDYTDIKSMSMTTPMTSQLLQKNDWYEPANFSTWWPHSGITSFQYDSFKHAFKVAKMLVEKQLIKDVNIGEFLTLVADIEREL